MRAVIPPWVLAVALMLCVGDLLPAQWRHYTGPRGGGTPGFDFDQFSKLRNGRPIRVPYADWDWWWDLNQDRFLRPERMASRAAPSEDQGLSGDAQSPSAAETQRGRQETLEVLRAASRDAFYGTRAAANLALGKLGGAQDHELLAALQAALADDHPHVAWSASLALGLLGSEDAAPFLLEVVRGDEGNLSRTIRSGSTRDQCRFFATVAIGLIGHRHQRSADDPVVIALLQMARGLRMPPWMRDGIPEDPPVGPGRPNQPAPQQRPPHNAINRERDLAVGAAIALQLMRIDGTAEAMLEIAKDASLDDYARSHMVIALGKCGATRVVPDLVPLLDDRMLHVSRSAAIALGLLASPRDAATLAALTRCVLTARDRSLRNFAIIALGEIGNQAGLTTLVDLLLESPCYHDRCYASLSIGIIGHEDPGLAREFWPMLRFAYRTATSESERGAHAIAMGLLRDHEAVPILREALADKERKDIRPHACTALGLLRDEASRPLLRKIAVGHGSDDSRSAAATALALLGDQDAVGPLIDSLHNAMGASSSAAVGIGHLANQAMFPRIAALATPTSRENWRAEMARPYAVLALGVMGDKDPKPLLSQIRQNSNYLAQCHLLAELLRIL